MGGIRSDRDANIVNSEPQILGGDLMGQAYIDINIVTKGGAKTGADMEDTDWGPIRGALLRPPRFDACQ